MYFTFFSANDLPLHVAGKVEYELQIGSSRMRHTVYMSDNIVDECLLGMDMLAIW